MKELNTFQRVCVHQYHATATPFDAITQQMVFLNETLRKVGIDSSLFAHEIHPSLRHVFSLPNRSLWDADCLLLHHSFGNPHLEKILKFEVPRVLVYHNVTPAYYLKHDNQEREKALLGRQQLQQLKSLIFEAVADSDYNAQELAQYGIPCTQTLPLFDMQTLPEFSADQLQERDTFHLLFVGRVTRHKNQAFLVKVVNELSRLGRTIHMRFIGSVEPIYGAFVKSLIRNYHLNDQIEMRGKVPRSELLAAYRNADAFLCASEHEGFCIPLVEAMRSNTIVFAFARTGIKETLGYAGVHLGSEDPRLIARAVFDVLGNKDLCRQLLVSQRRRVNEIAKYQSPRHTLKVLNSLVFGPQIKGSPKEARMASEAGISSLNTCRFIETRFPSDLNPVFFKRFEYLLKQPYCFSRRLFPAHFTASSLITNPKHDRVLLTHHRKLNKWLQLGGHAEGENDPFAVAAREASEESGIESMHPLSLDKTPLCFDIDIHTIPARTEEPSHEHFDFRFLFVANDKDSLSVSDESHDLRWFSLNDAYSLTQEASMHRQFDKLRVLSERASHLFPT